MLITITWAYLAQSTIWIPFIILFVLLESFIKFIVLKKFLKPEASLRLFGTMMAMSFCTTILLPLIDFIGLLFCVIPVIVLLFLALVFFPIKILLTHIFKLPVILFNRKAFDAFMRPIVGIFYFIGIFLTATEIEYRIAHFFLTIENKKKFYFILLFLKVITMLTLFFLINWAGPATGLLPRFNIPLP